MGAPPRKTFAPDYAVPPGETLVEVLESVGLTQAELAERMGRPKKTINEIVNGKAAITPETALQFERVLGIEAAFWTSLEHDYRAALARRAERERLTADVHWLEELPIAAMIKAGWIEARTAAVEQLEAVLAFFGVASVAAWQEVWGNYRQGVAFREARTFSSAFGAVAAWLRRSEIEARQLPTERYDATRFRSALEEIRLLTATEPETFCPAVVATCAAAGVAVVFIRELPGLRVCGATRWLTPTKAMIALTLRYKSNDHLWFTFFHEAAHVLLHGKRAVFLDEDKGQSGRIDSDAANTLDAIRLEEEEANTFSGDFLIPPSAYRQFTSEGDFSQAAVVAFAERIGIAPGIVVGRLQKDEILPWPTSLNRLKQRLAWAAA